MSRPSGKKELDAILAETPKLLAVVEEECKRIERTKSRTFYDVTFDVPGGYEEDLDDKYLSVTVIVMENEEK